MFSAKKLSPVVLRTLSYIAAYGAASTFIDSSFYTYYVVNGEIVLEQAPADQKKITWMSTDCTYKVLLLWLILL